MIDSYENVRLKFYGFVPPANAFFLRERVLRQIWLIQLNLSAQYWAGRLS